MFSYPAVARELQTICPGCQNPIVPGQSVTGVETAKPSEENPWGEHELWHCHCREFFEARKP